MSDIEDLRAEAEALGIRVHGNAGAATIRNKIERVRATQEAADEEPPGEEPAEEPVEEEPAESAATEDDGWPQQIAPLAWLDQEGRRYLDLGEAIAGAQECRERAQ